MIVCVCVEDTYHIKQEKNDDNHHDHDRHNFDIFMTRQQHNIQTHTMMMI